jgi:L-fuconolactonase
MEPWDEQVAGAARYPNVSAKVSGLNTAADPDSWSAADLKPYIDRAFDLIGAERQMFGSDWPVCELAGTYERVWEETNAAIAGRSREKSDAVLGETAERVYGF